MGPNDPKPNDDLANVSKSNPTGKVEVPRGHEQPKCNLQIMCEGGIGFQLKTPLSESEITNEIDVKGGSNRAGYAVIPTQPRPELESECLRVYRQRVVGYLVTVLGDGGNSRPMIHMPTDEAVMKIAKR